ncbi:type II toxin-antitoxin system RelE/ParE family toxin [Thiothrix sp.]|jgi:plasmid stabilization system protein ParE|uniref:type II toxin-antitoxin system RelE/ParE family toxin n=1 Tax=Thiothrix sp. TaxID=1032 RepID=UPI00257B759D|nr:type II toxin-antitoxin system RelE/ParE family toxin [Thiothrix sp.]
MNLSFHPEAEAEVTEAVDYYEQVSVGLGQDFANELYLAVERIAGFPNAWPIVDPDIRRCLLKRFPYGVLYAQDDDAIFVLAVMHLHREPDYWKHRV